MSIGWQAFVWYTVPAAQAQALQAAIAAMQAQTGVAVRLLERGIPAPDPHAPGTPAPDPTTWMEIWPPVEGDTRWHQESSMAQYAEAFGLTALATDRRRHVEWFRPCV